MCVGLEPNQQGQAALQEHASSSWPTIFQGVLAGAVFMASAAWTPRAAPARATATTDRNADIRIMGGASLENEQPSTPAGRVLAPQVIPRNDARGSIDSRKTGSGGGEPGTPAWRGFTPGWHRHRRAGRARRTPDGRRAAQDEIGRASCRERG